MLLRVQLRVELVLRNTASNLLLWGTAREGGREETIEGEHRRAGKRRRGRMGWREDDMIGSKGSEGTD